MIRKPYQDVADLHTALCPASDMLDDLMAMTHHAFRTELLSQYTQPGSFTQAVLGINFALHSVVLGMTCAGQVAFMTLVQDAKYKRTRRSLLQEEYVEGQKGGGVGQPESGFKVSLLCLMYQSNESQSVAMVNSLTAFCH